MSTGRPASRRRSRGAPDGRPQRPATGLAAGFSDRLPAGPLRGAPGLHEVHGPHQRRVHRRAVLDRRGELAAPQARAAALTRIASVDDVPVGGARQIRLPGRTRRLPALRPEPDLFVAYSQKCTHLSCAVRAAAGTGASYCPCHEGVVRCRHRPSARGPAAAAPHPHRPPGAGDDVFASGIELRTV